MTYAHPLDNSGNAPVHLEAKDVTGPSTQTEPTLQGKLVVILGPTASGKSALGISLAQRFGGEIISADSRQVYRGLDIGTAKVTPEERALVPHHLLDVADPREVYSVSRFQEAAIACIDKLLAREIQPFLVGGSPHYLQAVIDNLEIPAVAPNPELRAALEQRPLESLVEELERLDPVSAAAIDHRNLRRVIRALEVCLVTGRPFSEQRGRAAPRYQCLQLGINWPRPELYQRIDARIDSRLEQGLIEEVRALRAQGLSDERLDSFGLEYRFVTRWLRGEFPSQAAMTERLKFASHDFTRRQLSWFRKDQRIIWLEADNLAAAPLEVQKFLES